jgi:hypothetical protein
MCDRVLSFRATQFSLIEGKPSGSNKNHREAVKLKPGPDLINV